ncbi:hypothetical protein [Rhodococcus koreensis]|uniref:hypothetical protein n=1 Tax=Rhodococcus koreensis TaxID=99653 RepID=UPI00366FD354
MPFWRRSGRIGIWYDEPDLLCPGWPAWDLETALRSLHGVGWTMATKSIAARREESSTGFHLTTLRVVIVDHHAIGRVQGGLRGIGGSRAWTLPPPPLSLLALDCSG